MTTATKSTPPRNRLYLTLRGGYWHYYRRVPTRMRKLDGRGHLFQATKQPEARRAEAEIIAREINAATEAYWQQLVEGAVPSAAETTYAAAVERARAYGFAYRPVMDLASGPLGDILARVAALQSARVGTSPTALSHAAEALFGTVDTPVLTLGQLADRYFDIARDRQREHKGGTNANWRNRRRRAVELAVDAIGDKPLGSLTRSDALALRNTLLDMVEARQCQAPYANKVLGALSTMLREISDKLELNIHDVFGGLRLANAADEQREPMPVAHVRDVLLGPTALRGLNAEARAVIAVVASTGMRPIEFASARAENIVLDADVPHIRIVDGLKVKSTKRVVPLVGSALAAARAYPDGLKHYRNRNDALTTTIGKYLRENGLIPAPGVSLYSLRHTFKDRLKAVEAPEELIDQLMGHTSKKPKYGRGYDLDVLASWVERVAFDAPEWL